MNVNEEVGGGNGIFINEYIGMGFSSWVFSTDNAASGIMGTNGCVDTLSGWFIVEEAILFLPVHFTLRSR